MKLYRRINLIGSVSLDYPMGGNCVAGELGKTLEGLSICPGRVKPIDAIRQAVEDGGEVLLSDQQYFQGRCITMWGMRDFVEGKVRTIEGNNGEYNFRHRGSRRWARLSYDNLQELLIKREG